MHFYSRKIYRIEYHSAQDMQRPGMGLFAFRARQIHMSVCMCGVWVCGCVVFVLCVVVVCVCLVAWASYLLLCYTSQVCKQSRHLPRPLHWVCGLRVQGERLCGGCFGGG